MCTGNLVPVGVGVFAMYETVLLPRAEIRPPQPPPPDGASVAGGIEPSQGGMSGRCRYRRGIRLSTEQPRRVGYAVSPSRSPICLLYCKSQCCRVYKHPTGVGSNCLCCFCSFPTKTFLPRILLSVRHSKSVVRTGQKFMDTDKPGYPASSLTVRQCIQKMTPNEGDDYDLQPMRSPST